MTFLMCHLKSLIFDCISFTECLITCLSTADSEAPASTRTFVTSVCPSQIYSVGSRFNRVIELNEKMLILKRFVTKNDFFSCQNKEN
jgi:hypothetical protein